MSHQQVNNNQPPKKSCPSSSRLPAWGRFPAYCTQLTAHHSLHNMGCTPLKHTWPPLTAHHKQLTAFSPRVTEPLYRTISATWCLQTEVTQSSFSFRLFPFLRKADRFLSAWEREKLEIHTRAPRFVCQKGTCSYYKWNMLKLKCLCSLKQCHQGHFLWGYFLPHMPWRTGLLSKYLWQDLLHRHHLSLCLHSFPSHADLHNKLSIGALAQGATNIHIFQCF